MLSMETSTLGIGPTIKSMVIKKIAMPAWEQGCKLVCGGSSNILLCIQEKGHRCGRRLVQFMMETGRRGCAMALGCTA